MVGVILTAGIADSSFNNLYGDIATGMLPINGKPILYHIIKCFLEADVHEIYISCDYDKEKIISFCDNYFSEDIKFNYVLCDRNSGPGNSLVTVLKTVQHGEEVLLNLADTLVNADEIITLLEHGSFIITAKEFSHNEKWSFCKVSEEDGTIFDFLEKPEYEILESIFRPMVGVYKFRNLIHDFNPNSDRLEISDVLRILLKSNQFVSIDTNSWLDFGHLDNYQKSKKRLLEARSFNSLEFDDILGTITKRSSNISKFKNEIQWQLNLPKELSVLTPRVLDYSIGENPFIKMEYYGYPTISDLWLFSNLNFDSLKNAVDKCFQILALFRKYKGCVSYGEYQEVYINKTNMRLRMLEKDQYFSELLKLETIQINGASFIGWPFLKDKVFKSVEELYDIDDNCLIHGDYCFSNILFDINNSVLRLIDSRGAWGESSYGDIKYDYAKLRHSICGDYDYIVNDLFFLKMAENVNFSYKIKNNEVNRKIGNYFDNRISKFYPLKKIIIIESLLFLSMIPLHKGKKKRQIMMFLKSIELLNRYNSLN